MQNLRDNSDRILLKIAYRGEDFSGWQSQSHGKSVQDALERALEILCGTTVRMHGAGRTDAGVHALEQCAHFDVPAGSRFQAGEWQAVLNANLPSGVRVTSSIRVPVDFHSRFDAVGKIYRYRIFAAGIMSPFEIGRAWHVPGAFEEALFRDTLALFVGRHDFSCFCAGLAQRKRSPVRTIQRIETTREGTHKELISVEVEGDGFLYRMVRCLVGIGVRVARKKARIEDVARALQHPDPHFPRYAAPPDGLYLVSVKYADREPGTELGKKRKL